VRIFGINATKLKEIEENAFPLEREIQKLIEENLEGLFALEYIRSEFELQGLRIDTLAFDKETNAFVIIEYKKDRNSSVVDQGLSYLYLMLTNQADFILEYSQKLSLNLKKDEVEWSQSRVIFISPEFTKYQQRAIGFKDFAIELWEIHRYGNNLLILDRIEAPESKASISTLAGSNSKVRKVSQEIKVYGEEDHLSTLDDKTREVYESLKTEIMALGSDITIKPTGYYIGFWRKELFATAKFPSSSVRIKLNVDLNQLNDPAKVAKFRKKGGSIVFVNSIDQIPYAMTLIKQAYDKS
jgi:predicted transport protein